MTADRARAMRHGPPKCRRVVVILLATVLGILSPRSPVCADSAQWRKDYRQALESIEQEQWLAAARQLRQVLAGNSRESAEMVGKQPYLPHFYLGLALSRMNDCYSALVAWEESETQGVVQVTPNHQQLLEYRSLCEPLVLDPAIAQARKTIEDASRYAGIAEKQLADPEMAGVRRDHPALTESLQTALVDLKEVSGQIDAAVSGRRLRDLLAADRAAERVKDTLREAVNEAVGHLAQGLEERQHGEDKQRSSLRQEIRRLALAATKLIPLLARREASSGDEVARLGSQLPELSVAAAELDPAASIEQLEGLRKKLDRAIQRAQGALRQKQPKPLPPLPAPLLRAAEAYFRGDYRIAIELLSGQNFDDDRATAQGYLFRAAARFALYRIEDRSDEALLEDAKADIRTCRSFDGAIALDEKLFSPGFRRLFDPGGVGR